MIICNTHNFVVTRAPKVAGLSLEMYIHKSGLINNSADIYTVDGGLASLEELEAYSEAHDGLKYESVDANFYGWYPEQELAYITFSQLVADGKISSNMPCIGCVRHPVEWLASLHYYANSTRKSNALKNIFSGGLTVDDFKSDKFISEPNNSWDIFMVENENGLYKDELSQRHRRPQTDYYPDHAQLFNIENLHEHANAFISEKGGTTSDKIVMRDSNTAEAISYYLNNLSEDRKQKTLEIYEKDFIAWEKAYAVYN